MFDRKLKCNLLTFKAQNFPQKNMPNFNNFKYFIDDYYYLLYSRKVFSSN